MQKPIAVFFILLAAAAQGQSLQGYFMPAGLGYTFESVKDNSLSPVSYSGHFGRLHLGFHFQNNKFLSQFDLYAMGGIQRPEVAPGEVSRQTTTGLGRAHYSLSYQVYERNEWRFYGGILLHNLADYRRHSRYGNSKENFAGLFSFGPLLGVQKPFELFSQNWALQYSLGLPFGTYYLRPGYVKPLNNNAISAKGWAWWGNYYLIDSRTDLIWILANGNQIRLSYTWEYSELDVPNLNKVQIAGQHLTLSTFFRF